MRTTAETPQTIEEKQQKAIDVALRYKGTIIDLDHLKEIVRLDPSLKLNVRIKGVKFDRKEPAEMCASDIISGRGLGQHEYISQIWY
jgi:hypothetical protein